MLAPTDAALGKAVVTNTAVPEPVRESLNVESGLNDGICVPILLLFLTLAADESHRLGPLSLAALLTLQAIGIGAAVGIALGISGSSALRAAAQHGWTAGVWLQIPVVALALLAFGLSQWLGGSGFIAAFVGGMTLGAFTREHRHAVLDAAEGIGNVLAMLTWFAFGTMLFVLPFWTGDWRVFAFAVASLTVIRMLPVYLSVHRLRLRSDTKLFLGWFGPRGLASIVFAVMVIDEHLPGERILVAVTSWTILLSVLAHGLTANYLAGIYGKRVGDAAI
jgi:NhaP-type Na+/H+ or K+/H+ antiporter